MKKYWQIKPWMFIVGLVVLAASLFYAFDSTNYAGLTNYNLKESVSDMDFGGYAPAAPQEESSRNSGAGVTAGMTERMMIKTGSLSMVVDDVRKSATEIVSYVEEKGGFLVSSDINKYDINLSGSVTVRVPSDLLDETISYVKEMGEVESEHIEGQDVTEEYVDLEAKLKNLRASEEQFLKIMKDAVKIEDVLAVQRELTYVRENIEVIEGRMKYLNESVDLSSLTVYLSTDPSTLPVLDEQDDWKPFAVFKEALRSLLETGTGVVNGAIWFGVYLPVIIVLLLIIWGIKKLIDRRKK